MNYFIYIFFGILPSIIWLLFYLKKDAHPEPKKMVLKIFVYGMLAAFFAVFIELGLTKLFYSLPIGSGLIIILNTFLGVALVEEYSKYLVVKKKVLSDKNFDEPVDAMLYMIISALGFAALENILILLPLMQSLLITQVIGVSIIRFLGATFLHTLCSGLIGYFLARSFFETAKRKRLVFFGLSTAVLLHGLYNFSILKIEGGLKLLIPAIILFGLAIFVFSGFRKLKKMASVCKIN